MVSIYPPAAPLRERDLATLWHAGAWRGRVLHSGCGETYHVVYQGRPGGGTGPDFRDAVLLRSDGARLCGDIELHLRASAWRTHGHARDPRYNALALHVALAVARPAGQPATVLANGHTAPLVVLDLPLPVPAPEQPPWPCTGLAPRWGARALRALLLDAGMARFSRRVHVYREALARVRAGTPGAAEAAAIDAFFWPALAEALAYGRDREALREAGARLAAGCAPTALLAQAARLPRVEGRRLRGLVVLAERWSRAGPTHALRAALCDGMPPTGARAMIAACAVAGGLISPGRAAIVAANVVLPALAALGEMEGDDALAARARAVWCVLPGLPSNAITRLMARQLGLARLPAGAVAQQGLHELWMSVCHEKRCDICPCAQ